MLVIEVFVLGCFVLSGPPNVPASTSIAVPSCRSRMFWRRNRAGKECLSPPYLMQYLDQSNDVLIQQL